MAFLVERRQEIQVASYDTGLLRAAKSLDIPAYRRP
jgi:hypothetical protein